MINYSDLRSEALAITDVSRDTLMGYLFGGLPDFMSCHTARLGRKSKK